MPDNVAEQIPAILLRAARSICQVLTDVLPALTHSWWDDLVLASLSFQQQRAVEVRRIDALSGLDLAALLRVFEANWNAIAEHLRLPNEVRHYLKETRTVRDRWAHAASTAISPDDVYRDLDTLQRFLTAIGADDTVTEELKRLKSATIAADGTTATAQTPAPSSVSVFTVGQLVALTSNPATT